MSLATCPGHRVLDGTLIGMCIVCDRRAVKKPTEYIEAPAIQDERGLWSCVKFLDSTMSGIDMDSVHRGRA